MIIIEHIKALWKLPQVISGFNQLAYAINDVQENIELHKVDEDDLGSIIIGTKFLAVWWGIDHSRIGFMEQEVLKVIDVHDDVLMFECAQQLIGYIRSLKEGDDEEE